jgi:hypothetical protein
VPAAPPKSAHPGALAAIEEIYNAKHPKAVAKIVDDADALLEFYQYPAEHWTPMRTTHRTWSPSCAPARCYTTANCSNDPSTSPHPDPAPTQPKRTCSVQKWWRCRWVR